MFEPSEMPSGPVVSAVRQRGLGRVAAVQALEAARSAAWAGLLREVVALVDDMASSGGPAAPPEGSDALSRAGREAGTGREVGLAEEAAAAELALALVVPLGRAHAVVHEAQALCSHLPVTMSALETGRVDPARARVVVDETIMMPDSQARAVDAQLADALGPLTAPQLRARVRHLVATTDPAAVRRRGRRATCDRGVRLFPAPDGMAQLVATGPALDLAVVLERLSTTARTRAGEHGRTDPHAATAAGLDPLAVPTGSSGLPDRRSMDARRFDALVDLAGTADLPIPEGPGDGRGRAGQPHGPQVVVALTSLLGLDGEPAQLAGQGPVPVEQVRELLAVGHRFRRALTHPVTGHLIGLDGHLTSVDPVEVAEQGSPADRAVQGGAPPPRDGEHPPTDEAPPADPAPPAEATARADAPALAEIPPQLPPRRALRPPSRQHCPVLAAAGGGPYTPTAACQRYVRTRSPRCQAPGCRMPATRCDLDHRRPHGTGGPTCPCNLDVLCRRHHLAKHHHGWSAAPVSGDPRDAGLRWTSPLGQTAVVPAAPLLPLPGDAATVPAAPAPAPAGALPVRYPRGDAAAHDAARVHAELIRRQTEEHAVGPAAPGPRDDDEPPPF